MADKPATQRGVFVADVISNDVLCHDHYFMVLGLPSFPPTRPGQFVQLQCRGLSEQVSAAVVDWPQKSFPQVRQPELTDREPLLRRPLSLSGRSDGAGGVRLELIYRAIGTGTQWLSRLRAPAQLSVLGPLGNGFTPRPQKPLAALVGGGVGIPPLLYLSRHLADAGQEAVAFCGVRSRAMLPLRLSPGVEVSQVGRPTPCIQEFAASGVASVIATEDGSLGFAGMVSEALHDWLNVHVERGQDLVVYTCGPEAMMRAVAQMCLSRGIECQVAMERQMACGMGACQACVCKTRADNEQGWAFKLVCADGPVFDAGQLVW